jgi:hypothetical protein
MNKQNEMYPVVEIKFYTAGYTQTYLLLATKHRLIYHKNIYVAAHNFTFMILVLQTVQVSYVR